MLFPMHLRLLRQKLHQLLYLLHRVLRNHLEWAHRVVQFRHLQVAVVLSLLLLVVPVEHLALVAHQWVVVLAVLVPVLAPVVFLQVHLVVVQ